MRVGRTTIWDQAEAALKDACATAGVDYTLNPGEGAFYGPKLDSCCATPSAATGSAARCRSTSLLPERLDAEYVAEDGASKRPVMLHRAILGSLERFIGVLIEHYAGKFPLWLAPVQAVVATIVSDADAYAREVAAALRKAGLAVETDLATRRSTTRSASTAWRRSRCWRWSAGKRPRTAPLRCDGWAARAQERLALDEALHVLRPKRRRPTLRMSGEALRPRDVACETLRSQLDAVTRFSAPDLPPRIDVNMTGENHSQRTNARAAANDGPRVNEEIIVPAVLLIGHDGEMQGEMTAREACAGRRKTASTWSRSARRQAARRAR